MGEAAHAAGPWSHVAAHAAGLRCRAAAHAAPRLREGSQPREGSHSRRGAQRLRPNAQLVTAFKQTSYRMYALGLPGGAAAGGAAAGGAPGAGGGPVFHCLAVS